MIFPKKRVSNFPRPSSPKNIKEIDVLLRRPGQVPSKKPEKERWGVSPGQILDVH